MRIRANHQISGADMPFLRDELALLPVILLIGIAIRLLAAYREKRKAS